MVRHLGLIESARAVVSVLPLPPDQELRLRQTARQRATRHSTRIEGNTLNSQEVGQAVIAVGKTQTEMQQEVRNYWRALEWIEEQLEANRQPSEEYIRQLHSIILVRGTGRHGVRSEYRKDACPVVDSAPRQRFDAAARSGLPGVHRRLRDVIGDGTMNALIDQRAKRCLIAMPLKITVAILAPVIH
ncbi:MAG TPA: hypothetical protein VJ325_05920 [Thiobacillus sp.]|nr:hypothetical protein [Thiobacillus sp.]